MPTDSSTLHYMRFSDSIATTEFVRTCLACLVSFLFCFNVNLLGDGPTGEHTNPKGDLGPGADRAAGEKLGVIEGRVTFHGPVPKSPLVDEAGSQRDLLEVDSKTSGLQFAVVYLVAPASESNRGPDGNSADSDPPQKPTIVDQVNHTFVPHLIAIRSGESVLFTNSDPANHNVRASSTEPKNEFNVFVGNGAEYRHRFVRGQKQIPVMLACDIHPWMRGWIYVFDHSYFSVTDAQGKFRIAGVAPGEHRIVIHQPDARYRSERAIVVKSGMTTRLEIKLEPNDLELRRD